MADENCDALVTLEGQGRDDRDAILEWRVSPTGCADCAGEFEFSVTITEDGASPETIQKVVSWDRTHGNDVTFKTYISLTADEQVTDVSDARVTRCTCY